MPFACLRLATFAGAEDAAGRGGAVDLLAADRDDAPHVALEAELPLRCRLRWYTSVPRSQSASPTAPGSALDRRDLDVGTEAARPRPSRAGRSTSPVRGATFTEHRSSRTGLPFPSPGDRQTTTTNEQTRRSNEQIDPPRSPAFQPNPESNVHAHCSFANDQGVSTRRASRHDVLPSSDARRPAA